MSAFFAGVGEGHAAGIWEDVPRDRPEFRKKFAARMAAPRAARKRRTGDDTGEAH